jgi:uncharacterized membrane-anchored protein YitT (DUF2179 family)
MQNNLAEGGFTGITLLLYFVFGWDPAITNLILNIPLFFIGWKLLGRNVFLYTLIGTLGVSVFLAIFQRFQIKMPLYEDLFLAALFAGAFIGIGLGIIFRFGGTMFMFDLCVITLSLITYLNYREAMYTLVVVFIGARVIDFMQEGAYAARGAMIISDKNQEIADKIMKEMDRGVTMLKAMGSFTKKERNVLYCVVGKNEIVRLKSVINSVDPHAFVSVTVVHDVLGEGFTLDENKLPVER